MSCKYLKKITLALFIFLLHGRKRPLFTATAGALWDTTFDE